MDDATKFYILANDANGGAVMEFDEANLLARAIGANLEKQDPVMNSIAAFKDDKVSLLSAKDRMAAGHIGENQTPKTNLDLVHTAVALTGAPEHPGRPAVADPETLRRSGRPFQVHTGGPHPYHEARPRRPPGSEKPLAGTIWRGSTGSGRKPRDTRALL